MKRKRFNPTVSIYNQQWKLVGKWEAGKPLTFAPEYWYFSRKQFYQAAIESSSSQFKKIQSAPMVVGNQIIWGT